MTVAPHPVSARVAAIAPRDAWGCHLLLVVTMCLIASGCTQWKLVRRSQKWEPLEYAHNEEDKIACGLYRTWAEQEWQLLTEEIQVPVSEYYRRGFFDGFMDYTYAGGKVSVPPVPPRDFWQTLFRSEEGDAVVEQWRDGFLQGARVSRDKGYRRRATIPAYSQIEDHLNEGYPVNSADATADSTRGGNTTPGKNSRRSTDVTGPDAPAWDGLSEPEPGDPFQDDDAERLPGMDSLRAPRDLLPPRGDTVLPPPGPLTRNDTITVPAAELSLHDVPWNITADSPDEPRTVETSPSTGYTFEMTDLDPWNLEVDSPETERPVTAQDTAVVPAAATVGFREQFSAGDPIGDSVRSTAIPALSRLPTAGGGGYRQQLNQFRHPEQESPSRFPNRYSAQFQNQDNP